MGDTLSETVKKQCEDNGVYWIELRNNGWNKFGEVLESLNIKYSFDEEYKEYRKNNLKLCNKALKTVLCIQ